MLEFQFRKEHGEIAWVGVDLKNPGNEEIRAHYISLAFCFDAESGTLYKFGTPTDVNRWYLNAFEKYTKAGFPDMADALTTVSAMADGWDLEEINKFVSNTGYIGLWWKRLQEAQETMSPIAG